MGIMGLQAIYKGPNTSKKTPTASHLTPTCYGSLPITRPNHVCVVISPTPRAARLLYLVAIMVGQRARCAGVAVVELAGCQLRAEAPNEASRKIRQA
jgi:putative transposase